MRWKLTCHDAEDGSGDVILELPDDLLQAVGWGEGDTLELEIDPEDSSVVRLKKVVRCDVCDASTAETGHGVLQAHWRDSEAEGGAPVQVVLRLRDGRAQRSAAGDSPV